MTTSATGIADLKQRFLANSEWQSKFEKRPKTRSLAFEIYGKKKQVIIGLKMKATYIYCLQKPEKPDNLFICPIFFIILQHIINKQ